MICCSILYGNCKSHLHNIMFCKQEISDLINKVKAIKNKVDAIEIRCDKSVPTENDIEALHKLIFPKYTILTIKNIYLLEPRNIFTILSRFSSYDNNYIDIDYKYIPHYVKLGIKKNKLIASYHNYKNIKGFLNKYNLLSKLGTKYIKIAVTPLNLADLIELHQFGSKNKNNLILVGMGKVGLITRILYRKFGSILTYCAFSDSEKTAEGQIDIEQFLNIYRVNSLNNKTKLYGIIGKDISHSLSPYYYNKNFKLAELNCVYIPIDTPEIKYLRKFIKTLGFSGLSVTSPYKDKLNKVITNYDEVTESIKIVNTLSIKKTKVYAYNTDIIAFKKIIHEIKKKKEIKNVLILGSGCMARVAIYVLKNIFKIQNTFLYSRNKNSKFRIQNLQLININRFSSFNFPIPFDVIINCSKFGLYKHTDNFYEKILSFITKNTTCIELNYKIIGTPIVLRAKKLGCSFYTGIDFFRLQFKEQFKSLLKLIPLFF